LLRSGLSGGLRGGEASRFGSESGGGFSGGDFGSCDCCGFHSSGCSDFSRHNFSKYKGHWHIKTP
jgi:hypothetical protein